jgi:WD40 repeat protein
MAEYDAFLSHSRDDQAAVESIARRLREAGLAPFLDQWHLIPGEPWQEAIEEALEQSETVVVFIGPAGVSPWHNEEMRAALDRAVRAHDDYRVVPVLLPGALPEALTGFLARRTWVDFRAGLDEGAALDRLIAGIRGLAPEDPGPFTLPDQPSPYRGLRPFTAEHADLFFGRTADRDRLLEQVHSSWFVAIIGASGSGKSSLVLAGLLPALKQEKEWLSLVLLPGTRPVRALADQLALLRLSDQRLSLSDAYEERMLAREDGLSTAISAWLTGQPADRTLLIVVDQFEELFTQATESSEQPLPQQRAFISNLVDAARNSGGRVRVVLTLRADFLRDCLDFPDLRTMLEPNQMLLGPMGQDALREAIVRPAQVVGAMFEKGLVGRMLDHMRNQPTALPLLQYALAQLWERRRGVWLTHEAYESIGGVGGALEQKADEIYDRQLNDRQRRLARNLFLRLVTLGEGLQNTRRRITRDELEFVDATPKEVDDLITILSRGDVRLIATDAETVEVAHEALIERWGRLRTWLEQDREGLLIHRRLTDAAGEWAANERDESYLFSGARLAQVEEWAGEHPADMAVLEREFLESSLALREREAAEQEAQRQRELERARELAEEAEARRQAEAERAKEAEARRQAETERAEEAEARAHDREQSAARLRRRAMLAAALAVVAMVVAGFAAWQWRVATDAAHLARARALAAIGQSTFEEQPLLGVDLALEGLRLVPGGNVEAQASILDGIRQMASQGRLLKLGADVFGATPSPDSSRFVLHRADSPDELRRIADGQVLATLNYDISDVEFTPDPESTYLITSRLDKPKEIVELHRIADGSLLPLTDDAVGLHFGPNASAFVVDNYGEVPDEVRRFEDGTLLATLPGPVSQAFFSPGQDATVFVVSYYGSPGEMRRTDDGGLVTALKDNVVGVDYSPDAAAAYLVIRYENAPAELRRSLDGALVAALTDAIGGPVPFSPDGGYLVATYGSSAPAELRRIADGRVIAILEDLRGVDFSPDGAYLVLTHSDPRTRDELRRTVDGRVVATWMHVGESRVLFSPDSARLVVGRSGMAFAELRRTSDGTLLSSLPSPPDQNVEFRDVRFSPDPNLTTFYVDYAGRSSELRSLADGTLVFFGGPLTEYSFAPDMLQFVLSYRDAPGELHRTSDGSLVATLSDVVVEADFSPDGNSFVVSYSSGVRADIVPAELRRTDDGAVLATLPGAVAAAYYPPVPSPQYVVVGHEFGAGLWRIADGSLIATLSGQLEDVSFSPDASAFLVAYVDGQSEFWGGPGEPHRLAELGLGLPGGGHFFDAEGQRLVIWYTDGRGYLLDLDWLEAMGGDPALLSAEELERLACTGPLSTGLVGRQDLKPYLLDLEPRACR